MKSSCARQYKSCNHVCVILPATISHQLQPLLKLTQINVTVDMNNHNLRPELTTTFFTFVIQAAGLMLTAVFFLAIKIIISKMLDKHYGSFRESFSAFSCSKDNKTINVMSMIGCWYLFQIYIRIFQIIIS